MIAICFNNTFFRNDWKIDALSSYWRNFKKNAFRISPRNAHNIIIKTMLIN